jgi:hypothetical protein
VTLDRVGNRVVIEEEFELERPEEVQLSIMSSRAPESYKTGILDLPLQAGGGRTATLTFPASDLRPGVDTIQLNDAGLRESWGQEIYRILLKSQPVASGKWTYEFSAASNSPQMK